MLDLDTCFLERLILEEVSFFKHNEQTMERTYPRLDSADQLLDLFAELSDFMFGFDVDSETGFDFFDSHIPRCWSRNCV